METLDLDINHYDLSDIWNDIEIVIKNNLKAVNFATTPIKFSKVLSMFSYNKIPIDKPLINEDMRTIHSKYWGKEGHYLYTEKQVCSKLEKWICQ